jgi:hypothetical protein
MLALLPCCPTSLGFASQWYLLVRATIVVVALVASPLESAWASGCQEPRQAVQTEARQRIEGAIRVGVSGLGVGANGNRDVASSWAAQLASQEAVDNQWYLYYLCEEYEAGRIPKEFYCEVTSQLWERITGAPVKVAACMAGAAESVLVAAPVPASVMAPNPAPDPSTLAEGVDDLVNPPVAVVADELVQRPPDAPPSQRVGRWSAAVPGHATFDLYGPYDASGTTIFYVDNGTGCISSLRPSDGSWTEVMLAGPHCSAWSDVAVESAGDVVRVRADGTWIEFAFIEGVSNPTWVHSWSGRVNPVQKLLRRPGGWKGLLTDMGLAAADNVMNWQVQLSLSDRGGTTVYPDTGCAGELRLDSNGPGWMTFEETITRGACRSGAQVTLFRLSDRRALFAWTSGIGDVQDSCGILRAP